MKFGGGIGVGSLVMAILILRFTFSARSPWDEEYSSSHGERALNVNLRMSIAMTNEPTPIPPPNFIHQIIDEDNRTGKWAGRVATRFPPEPNGYLHIGHAKSICLNFGIAEEYGGTRNLRYDDTNQEKEEEEYVKSLEDDVDCLDFHPASVLGAS